MINQSVSPTGVTLAVAPAGSSLAEQVSADWDALADIDTRAPVFNYREWFMLAAQERLLGRWYVLTIRRHDRPIALFPLRKRTPWSWEVVSWFGHDEPQMLIDPAEETAVWQGVAHWLRHSPGVGYVTLGASRHSERNEAFARACHAAGVLPHLDERIPPTVLCNLPDTWDALLDALAPETRKRVRQTERTLTRDFPDTEMTFLQDPTACRTEIDDLTRIYRARFGGRGGGCVFDAAPNVAYYHRALEWAMRNGFVTLGLLRVNGRPCVVQTLFHIPGQPIVYLQMFGRDTTLLPKRYSPGLVSLCHLMRWAMSRGITTADLGPGAMPYKLILNGTIQPRWIVSAARTARDAALHPRLDRLVHIIQRAPVHAANYLRNRLRTGVDESDGKDDSR